MKDKLIAAVSDIINVPASALISAPENYRLGDPPAWDSLTHLAIMTELENLSGREVSMDDMERLDTLVKIIEFLEQQ